MSRSRSIAAFAAALIAASALGLPGVTASTDAPTPVRACDAKLNVIDQDPAGLNIRGAPAGAVIGALRGRDRWVQVHVTGQAGTWARIDRAVWISEEDGADHPLFSGVGYVAFSKIGMNELRTQSEILAAPAEGAHVLLKISEGDESKLPKADVLGCSGEYVEVRVRGMIGWTRDYCSNEFTTCV